MAKDVIDYRTRIRDRLDPTALHMTRNLDVDNTEDTVRLDIVAKKLTLQVPSTLTVDVEGSTDPRATFPIASGASNGTVVYGLGSGEHLVKNVKITRTAGSGKVVITAVSG